jgi:glycosyltransferase involved in cell wall biosynthesis
MHPRLLFHLVCAAATPVVAASKAYDAEFVAQQIGKDPKSLETCRRYLHWFGLGGLPPNRNFDPLRYVERNRPFAPHAVHPLIAHILYGARLGYDPAGTVWGCAGFATQNEKADTPLPLRVGVHAHIYYPDLLPEIAARLSQLPLGTKIFVTIVEDDTSSVGAELAARIERHILQATIVRVPNRGRDIWPFMMLLRDGAFRDVDIVLKIHTKKSPHLQPAPIAGAAWRRRMLFELLGSPPAIWAIVNRFAQTPDLGLMGPAGLRVPSYLLSHRQALSGNASATRLLSARAGINPLAVDFFAGSMFWARPEALEPLRKLDLSDSDFPQERGQIDGTLQHAIERLFVPAAKCAGFRVEDTLDHAPTDRAVMGDDAVTLPEYLVFGDQAILQRHRRSQKVPHTTFSGQATKRTHVPWRRAANWVIYSSYYLTRPIRQLADRFPRLAWRVRATLGLLWWTVTFQLASRLGLRRLRFSDLRLIGTSNLFDREWYLRENPNIRRAGVDPALHYLLLGASEGRDPSPLFDSDWYLSQNLDLRQIAGNPLVHYLRHGITAGHPAAKNPNPNSLIDSGGSVRPERARRSAVDGSPTLRLEQPRQIANRKIVDNSSTLNIVFINYGTFNNNSAGHIAGFANALAQRGHNVIMSAKGDPRKATDFGNPQFRCISRAVLTDRPQTLREILGDKFDDAPTLIHCWTARESVRLAGAAVVGSLGCPYFIHLEDNDEVVTRSLLGIAAAQASRMSSRDWDERVPSTLSHPFRSRDFISRAAGVTIIVDTLRTLVPDNLPVHLLEPGIDTALLNPGFDPNDRRELCLKLGVPSDARIVVYTGNIHAANAEEMLALYNAIHVLNRRGTKVHLIRTGTDWCPGFNYEFERLSKKYVTQLGFVERGRLVDLLKLADVFVQPGTAGEFNDYRLPSKLPEFLASGQPLILPATNVGLRLRDGTDALLLRRGDATEIADRVADVLGDHELADRLGRNARSFAVENFNWQRSALGLENFYHATLAARREQRRPVA